MQVDKLKLADNLALYMVSIYQLNHKEVVL